MKLRLTNATHFDTRDLRALVGAGLRALGDDRTYHVTVTYTRGGAAGFTSGYAYYGTGRIRLSVPKRDEGAVLAELPEPVRIDLARTLAHEIAHTNGVRHREMHGELKRCCRGGSDDVAVPWADGLPVRAKAPKPKADPLVAREAKALAMLERWTRKARLAATKVRKYRKELERVQRRAAARGTA